MPTCERCLNTDLRTFVKIRDQWICRRCIAYQGEDVQTVFCEDTVGYKLSFELTQAQIEISNQTKTLVKTSDVLIWAVCGAGKTELVMETIQDQLNRSQCVGVAVARKQVALQLHQRFKDAFPSLKVIVVCEGHTRDLEGHLMITTTHQLYRFKKTFDCLILDEPDAFPYRNNPVLEGFMRQAVKGHIIYLTATPDKKLLKRVQQGKLKMLTLNQRPHHMPLPIPELIFSPFWVQVIILSMILKRSDKAWLIFVPSLKVGGWLAKILNLPFAHASSVNLDELIHGFKTKTIKRMITTTVLERGVTFSDIQVAILKADHRVFDTAVLTQIAGRVGRDPAYPSGEVKFFCNRLSNALRNCLHDLKRANQSV
jgi:competence protein ComFA